MKLMEFKKRQNTHQTHLCDLVLLGREGLDELNDKIDKFIRRFNSEDKELNLTQKIDGAPALFCWSRYPGYPDNSIALKGFTSGPQNALSSNKQIDAKYGDRPDMAAKLKLGLQLAKHIPAGECWQGDCLFSKGDLKEENIDGTDYLTFMPNKIVYAFSEDNADYNKVKNADFGIAFHTIYKNKDGEMRQGFNVDPTRLNVPDNFYIMSPAINASKDKADYDLSALEKEYNNLKQLEQKLINDPAYEELVNNSTFMNYWNTFENANLADKKQVNLNVNTFVDDLKEYVNDKLSKEYNKKLNTVKTDKGKQSATDKYNKDTQELASLIDTHKDTLTNLVNCLNSAANIKMLMWAGLKKAKNDYSTFYKSRTKGYIPSEGEGIAMSDMDGNIVKIVDRSTFSSYNRDPDIMSGFEHESLQEAKRRSINEISKEDARRIIDTYQDETSRRVSTKFLGLKYYLIEDDEYTYDNPKYDEYMPTSYELHGVDIRGKRVINLHIYRKFEPKSFEIAEELYWKKFNMSLINNKLKNADLSNIDLGDLDEDFKINPKLDKMLGDKKQDFINALKKIILSHGKNDSLLPLGVLKPSDFENTRKDADGTVIGEKLKAQYDFWLNNFGLDLTKRGIGSWILDAWSDLRHELRDTRDQEYIDSLPDDSSEKLPPDEQFKMRLFYEWNVEVKDDYYAGTPEYEMSFREYLEHIRDDYKGHERDLIDDMIKEVSGGSGYFQEMMATQMADMGTFAKKPLKFSSKKKLKLEEDGNGKTAVIAAGRLNPPTIGHQKMIDALVSYAQGTKPKLFVTHTVDSKKNPLSYDSKVRWCQKAFGDKVEIPNTNAKTILQFLQELYQQGYTDIVYVGGGDRIGGAEDVTQTILKYNGQPDKQGNIIYDFNSIDFKNAGERSGDDLASNASASMARKDVLENNFDHFKQIVPFNENDAEKLFKELKYAMTGKEESFLEACNKRIKKLEDSMKVVKLNEEETFKQKRDLKKADSFEAAYKLLRQELVSSDADATTISQFDSAVKDIESITNTLDINTLQKLTKRLINCNAGLTPNQFIKLFSPTTDDLTILLKDNKINFNGNNDLTKYNFSNEFLKKLISYKGGGKSSTTAIGDYEFLIAVLFKGGSMEVVGGNAGDVSVSGKNIEVKKVEGYAGIGYDIGYAAELTKAFDDFVYNNLDDKNRTAKTRTGLRRNSYNVNIDKKMLPDELKKIVGNSGKISFSDLFDSTFKKLIDEYATRFDYLALCKGYNVFLVESKNNLSDFLLSKCKVAFVDYVGKRIFKISL